MVPVDEDCPRWPSVVYPPELRLDVSLHVELARKLQLSAAVVGGFKKR